MKKGMLLGVSCGAAIWLCASSVASATDMTGAPNGTPAFKVASVSGPKGADACASVATAKFEQWNQPKFMIHRTETFADGSKKDVEAIFMEDVAYGHDVGKPWETENIIRQVRTLPPPDVVVKRMGLGDCKLAGPATDTKDPASFYTYDYVPDERVNNATGKMWISDSASLPERQELTQDAEANPKVPVAISSTFAYGDDVQVPNGAIQSDNLRRWLAQQGLLMNQKLGTSGGGVPPSGNPNHR
ncbi:MAG TPA: hypothetical protein VHU23_15405 [Rhizomicrobium sp.]|nr:hypothetical protein [Rhizomicrobium sp.]